ncbi:MAG: glycosyltransferase family 2 protein [Alphaproteobacteria bacterium]|nr:glycosyltransferase family 2 protein [Alphaproteobacteria bacterium SS10]
MPATPKIDVCIPMWNEEKRIGRVLDGLVAQSFQDFTVSIYDNASTDGSMAICDGYRDRLDITVHQKALNIGQNANINRSFLNARGDYVAICSANDVLAPDYLEKLAHALDGDPDASMAYAKALRVDQDYQPIADQPVKWTFYSADHDDPVERACAVIAEYRQPSNFFALYRRSILDQMMPQPFRFGGDNVFVCEAATYGKIHCVQDALVYQSVSPGLTTMNERMQHLMRMFSMDHERGLDVHSSLAALEQLCPIVDMYHAHINMFRLAKVPAKLRMDLIERGSAAFMKRRGEDVSKNVQRVINVAGENLPKLSGESFFHRLFIGQTLRKIDECLLLEQPEALMELRSAYADLYAKRPDQ